MLACITKLSPSRQYGIGTKTDTQTNRRENPEIDPQRYGQLIFNKAGNNIHLKKKTISSANSAGKTGQQHAEE